MSKMLVLEKALKHGRVEIVSFTLNLSYNASLLVLQCHPSARKPCRMEQRLNFHHVF